MTMTVHNYRPRQFHRTSNGENPSSGYRDMGSAILAAAGPELRTEKIRQAVTEIWVQQFWQPPARTVTTIPLQSGGLRGEEICLGGKLRANYISQYRCKMH